MSTNFSLTELVKNEQNTKLNRKRIIQLKLFLFLDRPRGWKCTLYHLIIFAMVLIALVASAMETVQKEPLTTDILHYLEIILVIIFSMEYLLRIWAAGSYRPYRGIKGRLKYILRPINIIDLIVVISSICSLALEAQANKLTATAIKWLRIIQIVRIIHVDRRGSTWSLVSSVVYKHKQELITSIYIGFFVLLALSYAVFMAENYTKPSETFRTLADTLYWGMMTVTTIGYGDIVPQTWAGKLIISCSSVIVIAFFTIPAGILATGFALKVEQKQKTKMYNQQVPAAAILIQTAWRYKCMSSSNGFNATWSRCTSLTADYHKKMRMRRSRESRPSVLSLSKKRSEITQNITCMYVDDYDYYQLTLDERTELRIIYKIRYHSAVRQFQRLRNPFDVQDVIEQYSLGNLHLMMKIKELYRKLDQSIGSIDECGIIKGKYSVMDSLEKLNKKVSQIESVLNNMQSTISVLAAAKGDEDTSLGTQSLVVSNSNNPELIDTMAH